MPPRTRRSRATDAEDKVTDCREDNSALNASTGTNTVAGPHVVGQRAATRQINNLNKSDLTGGDGNVQGQRARVATVASISNNRQSVSVNPLRRTSSFYPGRCGRVDASFFPRSLEPSEVDFYGLDEDDDILDSENEWLGDLQTTELSQKDPSKISDAMMLERPSWKGPADTAGRSSVGLREHVNDVDTSPGDGVTIDAPAPTVKWPIETDIIFCQGSNKVSLVAQRSEIKDVIQDAIDNLRISLLFDNAFPDAIAIPSIIEQALLTAAKHQHGSLAVYTRLMYDKEYMSHLKRLPRTRVPLIRSDVKERVNAVVRSAFMLMEPPVIIETVKKRLFNYNYIFPTGKGLHTQPYRNEWIISVIRQLYFTGGLTSFANEFKQYFPTSKDRNGATIREVPVPMVALVATAIYATLLEWRTGERHPAEFSTNTFLDPYLGHINTFKQIQKRSQTFHAIMADIYLQAGGYTMNADAPTFPIADLDFDTLED